MNLFIQFKKPEITASFDWQLSQEVNVTNDNNEIIAKAEIELITINKHRDAITSYQLLAQQDGTDWEIPLNLYFKGQNLSTDLCEELNVKADTKKAKTHIMLEAISVLPAYRRQGVAKFMLTEIAKHHHKSQSITVFSMPMNSFVDADECHEQQSKDYYQQLNLATEIMANRELAEFFAKSGFVEYKVDESLLAEPLAFDIFIASPAALTM